MVAAVEAVLDLEDDSHFPKQWSRNLEGPGPLVTLWNCSESLKSLSPGSALSMMLDPSVVEFYEGNSVAQFALIKR